MQENLIKRRATFQNWINENALIDLGATGLYYSRLEGTPLLPSKVPGLIKRFANPNWRTIFAKAKVAILPKLCSDHSSLLISLLDRPLACLRPYFEF